MDQIVYSMDQNYEINNLCSLASSMKIKDLKTSYVSSDIIKYPEAVDYSNLTNSNLTSSNLTNSNLTNYKIDRNDSMETLNDALNETHDLYIIHEMIQKVLVGAMSFNFQGTLDIKMKYYENVVTHCINFDDNEKQAMYQLIHSWFNSRDLLSAYKVIDTIISICKKDCIL